MKVSLNTKVMNVFCGINSKIRLNKLFDYMLECSIKQEEILKEQLKDLNGSGLYINGMLIYMTCLKDLTI